MSDIITKMSYSRNFNIPILSRLPEYFERHGFKTHDDAYNSPFQYVMGTKPHYFDWLQSQPRFQSAFNTAMGMSRLNRGEEWFESYPVEEKLVVKESSDPLLDDIAGGRGHDLIAFNKKFPNLGGKLILQDLPIVVDDIKGLPSGIEAMKHDFFEPHPLKVPKLITFAVVSTLPRPYYADRFDGSCNTVSRGVALLRWEGSG